MATWYLYTTPPLRGKVGKEEYYTFRTKTELVEFCKRHDGIAMPREAGKRYIYQFVKQKPAAKKKAPAKKAKR